MCEEIQEKLPSWWNRIGAFAVIYKDEKYLLLGVLCKEDEEVTKDMTAETIIDERTQVEFGVIFESHDPVLVCDRAFQFAVHNQLNLTIEDVVMEIRKVELKNFQVNRMSQYFDDLRGKNG